VLARRVDSIVVNVFNVIDEQKVFLRISHLLIDIAVFVAYLAFSGLISILWMCQA
jgi:hypothetical protein